MTEIRIVGGECPECSREYEIQIETTLHPDGATTECRSCEADVPLEVKEEYTVEEAKEINQRRREAAYEAVQRWVVCPECGSDNATTGCPGPQVRCEDCGAHDDVQYKRISIPLSRN